MRSYSIDVVQRHIRQNHPGCPEFAIVYFSNEVASKKWRDASLGKAVGITMQTFLRHQMTDYDTLLLVGMNRAEARQRVQPRITAMINSWRNMRECPSLPIASEIHGNTKIAPLQEITQQNATEAIGSSGKFHREKRVGMTFNVEREWHKKFKITAASRGLDMHQLLMESFAAWERQQK